LGLPARLFVRLIARSLPLLIALGTPLSLLGTMMWGLGTAMQVTLGVGWRFLTWLATIPADMTVTEAISSILIGKFFVLSAAVDNLSRSVGILSASLKTLITSNPYLLALTAALTALSALFFAYQRNLFGFRKAVDNAVKSFKKFLGIADKGSKKASESVKELNENITNLSTGLGAGFDTTLWKLLQSEAENTLQQVLEYFGEVPEEILGPLGATKQNVEAIFNSIQSNFEALSAKTIKLAVEYDFKEPQPPPIPTQTIEVKWNVPELKLPEIPTMKINVDFVFRGIEKARQFLSNLFGGLQGNLTFGYTTPVRGERQLGGPIFERGYYLLHGGEYVMPRSQVRELVTPTTIQHVTIYSTVNIGNVSSEIDLDRLAEEIDRSLAEAVRRRLP